MHIKIQGDADAVTRKAKSILQRVIDEKTAPMGGCSHEERRFNKTIHLIRDRHLPAEGFRIEKASDDEISVIGGDGPGVLYGCGKLLRLAEISPEEIVFHDSPELSAPVKKDRGMYFAVHNFNTYTVAPDAFIERYIEELALWGINDIAVLYHKFYYTGIDDVECLKYIKRLNFILTTAKSLGMKTTVLLTINDGYNNSPVELRYKRQTPRNWGTEICVSQPEGMKILKREFEEILNVIAPIDQVVVWPYDSGGCGCDQCSPWGIKGYIRVAKELSEIFRRMLPHGKYYLGTWYFDYNCGDIGEWDSLFEKLDNNELDWVDGILADGAYVNGCFPKQIIEHDIDKPVISFMEISMVTGRPWGGFGSNPIPQFIQEQWDLSKDHIIGGVPYSEGIFEDVNKVLWLQLCWSPDRKVMDILKEYVRYEFSNEYADELTAIIAALEPARMMGMSGEGLINDFSGSIRIWEDISFYDRCLDWNSRNSWRWRHTLLRAKIDAELARSGGEPTPEIGRIYDELFHLYRLTGESHSNVRPHEIVADKEKGGRSLKETPMGKSFRDFCSYRDTPHEDTVVKTKTQKMKPLIR